MPITKRNLRRSMKKYNLSNNKPTKPTMTKNLFETRPLNQKQTTEESKTIIVKDNTNPSMNTNTTKTINNNTKTINEIMNNKTKVSQDSTTSTVMSNLNSGKVDLLIEQCTGQSLAHRSYEKVLKTKNQFIRDMEEADKEFHEKLYRIKTSKPSFNIWFDEDSTYETKIKDFHRVNENKKKRVDRGLSTWNTKDSQLDALLKEYYTPNDTRTKLVISPVKIFNCMLQDKIVYTLDQVTKDRTLDYFSLEYDGYIYNINCDSESRSHFNTKTLIKTIKSYAKKLHVEMANKWCEYLKQERYEFYCSEFNSVLPKLPFVVRVRNITNQDVVEMCNYACKNGKIILLHYMPLIAENYGKQKQLNEWVINNYNWLLKVMDNIQINKFFDLLSKHNILDSNELAHINNISIDSRNVLNISDMGLMNECKNNNYNNVKDIVKFPHIDYKSWNYMAIRHLSREDDESIKLFEKYELPGRYDPLNRRYAAMM